MKCPKCRKDVNVPAYHGLHCQCSQFDYIDEIKQLKEEHKGLEEEIMYQDKVIKQEGESADEWCRKWGKMKSENLRLKKERQELRQQIIMNGVWTDKQSLKLDQKDEEIYRLGDEIMIRDKEIKELKYANDLYWGML